MARREYHRTGETVELDAEAVQSYLQGKGYIIGPGGVGTGLDGLIVADIDPNVPDATWTADLDAFVPAADPQRTARAYLIARGRAIKAKDPATRTVAERDLLALLVTMRQDG